MGLATTGVPQAIDSSSTFAQPSRLEESTDTSAALNSSARGFMRHGAEQAHPAADAARLGTRQQRRALLADARDQQRPTRQTSHGLDGQLMTLALDQRADGDSHRPVNGIGRSGRVAVAWGKHREIHAIAQHGDFAAIRTQRHQSIAQARH